MYQNILVAYHGNSKSPSALHECTRLLAAGSPTHVHVLVVIDPPPTPVVSELGTFVETTYEADLQIARERVEEDAHQAGFFLKEHGLQSTLHIECGDPVDVIADLVEKLSIDLIIIGHSRQKAFALRWWRGATDTMLVEKVRCSVLVAADAIQSAAT
jgi:nucleotide-binding universal stress UspA family protein